MACVKERDVLFCYIPPDLMMIYHMTVSPRHLVDVTVRIVHFEQYKLVRYLLAYTTHFSTQVCPTCKPSGN